MPYNVLLAGQLTWNIPLLAVLFFIVSLYIVKVKPMNLNPIHPILFIVGLCLFYLIIGSPIKTISHLSFSLHMVQMAILYFIIPPLILLGIPEHLFYQVFSFGKLYRIGKLFLSPKLALYSFAILFLIYHVPFVFNVLSQSLYIQNGYELLLFLLSFSMWWPITSPDPKQRLSHKDMKRYTFLSGVIIMPACLFFILTAFIDGGANNPFLSQITAHLCIPAQTDVTTILPISINTKLDQFMAGILMMGVHKLGLVMAIKLEDRTINKHLKKTSL